jgi:NAD(P)H-flavin reductase
VAEDERRFHPARLVLRGEAGGGLTRMTLEPAPEVAETHIAPGQYIEVRADGETGFFVLANDPGAGAWELVMRSGGGASDVLLAKGAAAALEVSAAIGAGFPMAEAKGRPLLVALVGTGIAAGPPILRRRVRDGDAARTHAYVGVRTGDELPIRRELLASMRAGVRLVVCMSQGTAPDGEFTFALGRVPEVLRGEGAPPASLAPQVFAVGPASLVDALRALAREWGIPPDSVHTNH